MGTNRDNKISRSKRGGGKFKSPDGVGSRRENPDGYVAVPGSPSLEELRKNKLRITR